MRWGTGRVKSTWHLSSSSMWLAPWQMLQQNGTWLRDGGTLGQAPAGWWGWQDTELTRESSACEKKKHSAENSGVLGLEGWTGAQKQAEAGPLGHCMDIEPQIKYQGDFTQTIKKKNFFGVKLLQCDYSHSLSWLTHDTNLPQNHSLWSHSLNDQKAVAVSIKTMGLGRQSYGHILTEQGKGPELESPEPTENQTW